MWEMRGMATQDPAGPVPLREESQWAECMHPRGVEFGSSRQEGPLCEVQG